ncbi:MAG TPA: VacJ family lipoprotein [Gammaproteobacteria bacterium]|nr:VacJ family lipoprotein [Gammaproteobacteria bacterium]HQY22399.1 VacJ family lipoprotein [Gammaproteobacteria bacterium]HQZ87830.1 VacJ family lipoprotein [Gammaproteobacteria bacterium]HRA42173.1 VacJ family lipoprotein [Gammaproteobacteria bacterium]
MSKNSCVKFFKLLGILLAVTHLIGCGKSPSVDRFEMLNRSTYSFNKNVDRFLIKPISRAYEAIIPKPIQIIVGNFFQNLSEIPNIGNDILQGNFHYAQRDTARFLVNSTWGLGGLFDVAGKKGLERHHQDFGLTLAKWGYTESSYLVLPILGPSTIRDGVGLGVTYQMGVSPHLKSVALRNNLMLLYYIDTRASLLKVEPLIGEAVDEYVFIRDAYLQRRKYLISGEKEETATEATLEGPPE